MVLPALLIPIAAAGGASLITGIASYFAFRSSAKDNHDEITTKGEIYNNVELAVQENNTQNNALVMLVGVLVLIKFIEVTMFCVNAYKRSIKRKYMLKVPAIAPRQNQENQV